jgi:long-chain fatty acid transport protein
VAFFGRPAVIEGALAVTAVANQVGDSPTTAELKVPASFSVSVKHQLNPSWDVLGDVTWTEWSSLQDLNIVRTNGFLLESTPFKWRDTWRIGLGANYRMSQPWTLRFGVAYDQTPTSDTYRTPRVPDQNRTWLALGAQYKVQKDGALDIGYAHLFVKDSAINMSGPPSLTAVQAAGRGSLIGNFSNKVDIFSVQYSHSF